MPVLTQTLGDVWHPRTYELLDYKFSSRLPCVLPSVPKYNGAFVVTSIKMLKLSKAKWKDKNCDLLKFKKNARLKIKLGVFFNRTFFVQGYKFLRMQRNDGRTFEKKFSTENSKSVAPNVTCERTEQNDRSFALLFSSLFLLPLSTVALWSVKGFQQREKRWNTTLTANVRKPSLCSGMRMRSFQIYLKLKREKGTTLPTAQFLGSIYGACTKHPCQMPRPLYLKIWPSFLLIGCSLVAKRSVLFGWRPTLRPLSRHKNSTRNHCTCTSAPNNFALTTAHADSSTIEILLYELYIKNFTLLKSLQLLKVYTKISRTRRKVDTKNTTLRKVATKNWARRKVDTKNSTRRKVHTKNLTRRKVNTKNLTRRNSTVKTRHVEKSTRKTRHVEKSTRKTRHVETSSRH